MKKKDIMIFENYEKVSESQENNLVGGFSKSFSNQSSIAFEQETNNCHGGNCMTGCGGNSGCNTIAGCGAIE